MSKALYRKYRSRSFDEVVGQEHITTTLKNALKKGAVSHAYLFTGPRGVGKTSIARILAHAINDLAYTDESTHLDIIEIDAASNRKIDEIRELRSKVHIAPTSAKYKVYIIDEVHMLTREAFNALLKTLEEPPAHAVFILATTEAHKVPDTIVSRTQRFTFRPISRESTVDHLKNITAQEGVKIDDDALELLADHGRGSFRDSISMLDQLAGIGSEASLSADDVRMLLGVPSHESIAGILQAAADSDVTALFERIQHLKEQGIHSGRAAIGVSELLRNQLLTNNPQLDRHKAVALLKNLLPLSTTTNDYLGLELALLEHMVPAPAVAITNIQHTGASPAPHNEQTAPLAKQPHSKTPQTKQKNEQQAAADSTTITESQPFTANPEQPLKPVAKTKPTPQPFKKETWLELLNDLKKKHNTLYGVLRMSEPAEEDGHLRFSFKFGFHKKQIDLPKNTAILRDYLLTYFGISEFTTHVAPHQKSSNPKPKPAAAEKEPKKNDVISSVSDIFGGAELLE